MNTELRQIQQVASAVLGAVLQNSPSDDAGIKTLISVEIDGQQQQLLIVGNTHRHFNDANCVAVLNPDETLVSKIKTGVGYTSASLKEIVSKRCDAMVKLQMIGRDSRITTTYRSRRRRSAVSVAR